MTAEPRLTLSAADRSYVLPADQAEFVIGRDAASDLIVVDAGCSRRHARVVRVAGVLMVEPLSDRARTYINGAPIASRSPLANGDVIRVGETDIHVGNGGLAARPTPVQIGAAPRPAPVPPAGGIISVGEGQTEVVIGRDASVAAVVIDHPSISRRHALLGRTGDGFHISDLGSTNGVSVNGRRISSAASLAPGDAVALGPVAFTVEAAGLRPSRLVAGVGLSTADLVLDVVSEGTTRRLLDRVSLRIEPGRFVAVLGPSGCGKSKLIESLSGRVRMTSGSASVGGLDLEGHFDTLKHLIGFVPQHETLPEDLPLRNALRYTAQLRLSSDSSAADVRRAVDDALVRVGMKDHADKQIAKLSGGQRKRAALANELIARPAVIFADEVTSGLDDSTDREIMRLFQRLAGRGVTIVCVTHTVSNIADCCDDIAVMALGGRLAFLGPPSEALEHFGVSNLAGIYDRLESPTVLGKAPRGAARAATRGRVEARPDRRAPLAQLPTLVARTAAVTLANRRSLAFLTAQSILVGLMFRLVFGAEPLAPAIQPLFVFLVGISSFWFGCSNASKEIVKERRLFRLERDINLRVPSYVLSKLSVLGVVGVMQVVLLLGTMSLAGVEIPRPMASLGSNLGIVLVGSSLGLVVSAFSRREEQAASLVPMALIPQLLLSAALVPQLSDLASWIARGGVSAYWMYRLQLDLLAPDGPRIEHAAMIFAGHGVVYALLAGIILYADRSGA